MQTSHLDLWLLKIISREVWKEHKFLKTCFNWADREFGPVTAFSKAGQFLREGQLTVGNFYCSSLISWRDLSSFIFHQWQAQIQEGLRHVQAMLFQTWKRLMKAHREPALAWLATLVNMNEVRTTVTPQIQAPDPKEMQANSSDGNISLLCYCSTMITHLRRPRIRRPWEIIPRVSVPNDAITYKEEIRPLQTTFWQSH